MKLRIHSSNNNSLRYVQIFGERNSGTNHLKALVSSYMNDPNDFLGSYPSKKNPENTTRMFGYKHYYAKDGKVLRREQAETLFLVLYKNPYTWIRSTMEKPYHFRENLQDRSIVDLPQILLTGTNVRGEPIPDVDPLTGDSINIFDLRRFKIANWEALSTKVDNVVYINYEMLLMYPKDIVQSILAGFQGPFRTAVADDHEPDARYVQKYVNPLPFTSDEMAVMDSHIDWATEARVGYERGNLFI